jgi:ATP dependent DNA ligase domain
VLEKILKPKAGIQLGSYVENEGKALFHLTKEKGMEGIIAKRKNSLYRPGKRTSDWLKIKARLNKSLSSADSRLPMEAGSIWARSSWVLTLTASCATMAMQVPALPKKV